MATFYVDAAQPPASGDGTPHHPFSTITAALAEAEDLAMIHIAPGHYNRHHGEIFPLYIPSGVTLLGDRPSQGSGIIIHGNGPHLSPSLQEQQVTIVAGDRSALRGLSITNSHPQGTGVWLEDVGSTIDRNSFIHCGREAIFVTGRSKITITHNYFSDHGKSAIFFVGRSKGEVRHNHISNSSHGIAITEAATPLIFDNHLINNKVGILIARQGYPVLRRNCLESNQIGLQLQGDGAGDLGNEADPGKNRFCHQQEWDISVESSQGVVAVGNDLSPHWCQGDVTLVGDSGEGDHWGPVVPSDVVGHWAEAFILALMADSCFQGVVVGDFLPDRPVTRGEYAQILSQCFQLPRQVGVRMGEWMDVAESPLLPMYQQAVAMGFLTSDGGDRFDPQRWIGRGELFHSLVQGLGLTGGDAHHLQGYGDRHFIPSALLDSVITATHHHLVVNYPDPHQLQPQKAVTRGELAAILYQGLVCLQQLPPLASPHIVTPSPSGLGFRNLTHHWAREVIEEFTRQGLVIGEEDGRFLADYEITRWEYAWLVSRIFKPRAIRPRRQFFDLKENIPYYDDCAMAYQGGFLQGFPDQTFHPEQTMKRLHVVVSLVMGLGWHHGYPLEGKTLDESRIQELYQDWEEVPSYARPALCIACDRGLGLSHGQGDRILPHQGVTLAESLVWMHQAQRL